MIMYPQGSRKKSLGFVPFLRRRFEKKINTNIASQIVNEIKKNKQKALLKYEKKLSKNDKIKPTAK